MVPQGFFIILTFFCSLLCFMLNHHTSLAERAQVLALLKYKININSVITYTEFSRTYLCEIRKKARDYKFNSFISFILKDKYLTNAP